jgi:hypothetical protein
MRDKRALWSAPAWLALLGLTALTVWLIGAGSAAAGGTDGSVSISPQHATVGAGGTASVDVIVDPPEGGLSIWIVEVKFESEIVQVDDSSGFNCEGADLPGGGVSTSLCEGKQTDGDPEPDSAVAIGAFMINEGGTGAGLEETTTIATIHFDAVGDVGECSDLEIEVLPGNFLEPDNDAPTPAIMTDVDICIVAGETVLWGDLNCSDTIDAVDALAVLRHDAGLSTNTGDCPAMGETITVEGETVPWGDLACSGAVDAVDGLLVLRFDAGLSANTGDCPDLNTNVQIS